MSGGWALSWSSEPILDDQASVRSCVLARLRLFLTAELLWFTLKVCVLVAIVEDLRGLGRRDARSREAFTTGLWNVHAPLKQLTPLIFLTLPIVVPFSMGF
jgi:hypothetical protein